MNKPDAVTASLASIYDALKQVFPPYHVVNVRTVKDRVIVDVIDYVADWIWSQDTADWESFGGNENYIYSRYIITQELFMLMVLRWPR